MEEHSHLPDLGHLSTLMAVILLAYATTSFITLPTQDLSLQLPNFYLEIPLSFSTAISFLTAALAAVGSEWLVRDHPRLYQKSTIPHWFLPALSAWAIGVPLGSLEVSPVWWLMLGVSGLLLVLVFIAEYIAVDPSDVRHTVSTVMLTAVSFALFLILAVAVRGSELRLYLSLAVLIPASFLVTLRTMQLRLGNPWRFQWALGIGLIIGQLALGLHYWPLLPVQYGLLLLGPAYGLTSIAISIEESQTGRGVWIEPVVMTLAVWLVAVFVRS